ncbi:hypothetical protein BU107_04420 [Staphylococcus xylosus]|uniref:hypothetical protein n=1 Tax=Staphylococcus xylosus TaxID=1288 RepID=UPI000E6A076E|nr:hypothetical protein [Staphylococcus xylosus]RIM88973.1 hypothetical protein BU107_04420 [Staphylococcus xylosus]
MAEKILIINDIAKNLRKELKNELGYNNRKVSVKQSGLETLIVSIKDYTVSYQKVKSITDNFESIDRDEATGEILVGGNVFIRIEIESVDPKVLKLSNEIMEDVEHSNSEVKQYEMDNYLFIVINDNIEKRIQIKRNNIVVDRFIVRSTEQLAKEIALLN